MRRIGLLLLLLMVSAACNLIAADQASIAQNTTPIPTLPPFDGPTATPGPLDSAPTLLSLTGIPAPGIPTVGLLVTGFPPNIIVTATLQPGFSPASGVTNLPGLPAVTSAPPLGTQCQVYTTYSGTDPRNVLSLRSSPSASAPQVFLVPTNTQVMLVPNSQEVDAESYHWLNVIYAPAGGGRYQGWIARDSYLRNGIRDPSVPTLIATGTTAAC